MASNYYYLKLHYDILDDWKVGTLPDSLKWLFIQCLCVAGEYYQGGLLPEINQFAFRIRREPQSLHSDMARLAANGLAELVQVEGEADRWFITNYAKRQKKISNAQKQRDYRTRKRKQEMAESNATVTDELPERYDSVTTRNTDKIRLDKIRLDTDKDERENTPRPPLYDQHQENTPNYDLISRIAGQVSNTYVPGFDDDLWDAAVNVVIANEGENKVNGFNDWWQVEGWYSNNGKANLKHFIDSFKDYCNGVTRTTKPSQSAAPTLDEVNELISNLEEEYSNVVD